MTDISRHKEILQCWELFFLVSLLFIRSLPNMCLLYPLFSSAWSKSYPLRSLSVSFSTFHMIFNGPCWCSGAALQYKCRSYCLSLDIYELWLQHSYSSLSMNSFDNISIKTLLQALITSQLSITLSSLTERLEIKDGSQITKDPRPVSSPGPQAVCLILCFFFCFELTELIWAVKMPSKINLCFWLRVRCLRQVNLAKNVGRSALFLAF